MAGEALKLFPLKASPGIKRDTTDTEGNYYSQGQWSRFYRGLPRSIGGYRSMSETYYGPSRGLLVNPNGSGYLNIFSGSASNLVVGQFTSSGFGNSPVDITPSGFTGSSNNVWQMDLIYDAQGSGTSLIIAHAAPNLSAIDSNVVQPVYYGNVNGTSALTATQNDSAATFSIDGGIVCIPPFVIAYGSNGLVCWSQIIGGQNPAVFPVANAANVCATKIVKGLSLRGGAPACLLWSLDCVIQMSYTGGSTVWNFSTLSDQSSILSSSGVVEYDGVYYWPGIDRWLTFNGSLHELPNLMNLDFFYSNLNYAQRQKVFGFKVPRWGEIWWCAPMFGATECNWAFIYNVRENTWYDTPLPSDGRSAAYFADTWQYPIMSSANGLVPIGANTGLNYPLYQHELGTDFVRGNQINAIDSYVLSPTISLVGGGLSAFGGAIAQQENVFTEYAFFEPDFKFGNNLMFSVYGRMYPQDADTLLNQTTITQQSMNNHYDLQVQARYLRWKIESNSQGGFYVMGQPLISYRTGDRQA